MNNSQRGITLIELAIVVVIVGILASVAIPTYRSQTLRSNRSAAKVALTQAAQSLERCYTTTLTYVGCPTNIIPDNLYTITLAATQTTYTLTAAPADKSAQLNDKDCTSLTLDQRGARGSSPSAPEVCWAK